MKVIPLLVAFSLLATSVWAGNEIKVCFCKDIDIVFKHENAPLRCSEGDKNLETFKGLYAKGWRLIQATKSGEVSLLYFERPEEAVTYAPPGPATPNRP